MTLARDASSPALVNSGYLGSSPESLASNSFSPPAGSVIIVTAYGQNSYAPVGWTTPSVTDSLGSHLSWTLFKSEDTTAYETGVWAWWAYTASAPGSMTVTPTLAAGGGQYIQVISVAVDVWTGANTSSPIGATASSTFAGQALSQSLTPNASGSALVMAAADGANTGTQTAGTNCYMLDADATNHMAGEAWYGTSGGFTATTASTPETLAITGGSASAVFEYIAYEVLAASGGGGGAHGPSLSDAVPMQAIPGFRIALPPPVSGVTVTPTVATATGTAQSPSVLISPNAVVATATGTAQSPVVLVKPNATVATALGTAQSPAVSMTANGTLASGTGSALSPPVQLTVFAGLATGSGTAQSPGVALTPGLATGAGTSQSPAVSLTVNAGLASGVATSQSPAVSLTVFAGLATGSGTAQPPVATVASNATVATGSGTAQSPNPSLTVLAGLATGLGTAQSPNPSITVNAGLATATGNALNPTGFPVFAGLAAGSGTSQSPAVSLTVLAGLATASGTAQSPTVSEGDTYPAELAPVVGTAQSPAVSLTVFAGLATGSGTSQSPVVLVKPNAGLATGSGTAQSPAVSLTAFAGLATGLGTAQSPVAAVASNATVATGSGTAQSPAVKLTAFAGLATGKGTAQQPTVSFGIRHALNLGGSATPEFPYDGSFTEENLGGSVSYGNLLGGSAAPALNWGGSATLASPDTTSGGTATTPASTLGGSVSYGNTLGGAAIGWTMQQVNLTLAENNDETVDFAITSNSAALDISTATVNVYFKTAAGTADGSALMFSSGGGSPAITITNGPGGLCTLAIPHADLYPETYTFYRLDVVFSGLQNTAIYGNITWVTL